MLFWLLILHQCQLIVFSVNILLWHRVAWENQKERIILLLSAPSRKSWSCLFSSLPLLQSPSCRWLHNRQQLSPGDVIKYLSECWRKANDNLNPPRRYQKEGINLSSHHSDIYCIRQLFLWNWLHEIVNSIRTRSRLTVLGSQMVVFRSTL